LYGSNPLSARDVGRLDLHPRAFIYSTAYA
jgi:hypothetical protein